jgi:serine/threonine protein kinase
MNPPPTSDSLSSILSPGTRFGRFEILQRLGAGGMGEVYRAKDTRLDREVAIKTISLGRGSEPEV